VVCPVYFAESEESRGVIGIYFENILLENVRFIGKEVESELIVESHWIGESKAVVDGNGDQLRVALRVLL